MQCAEHRASADEVDFEIDAAARSGLNLVARARLEVGV
jgi:hypothetical protein